MNTLRIQGIHVYTTLLSPERTRQPRVISQQIRKAQTSRLVGCYELFANLTGQKGTNALVDKSSKYKIVR